MHRVIYRDEHAMREARNFSVGERGRSRLRANTNVWKRTQHACVRASDACVHMREPELRAVRALI